MPLQIINRTVHKRTAYQILTLFALVMAVGVML